jgi:Mannosyltransferase (PIG-V)
VRATVAVAVAPAPATTPSRVRLVSVRESCRPLVIYVAARVWMLLVMVGLIAVHRTTTFSEALLSWDGGWYVRAAERGYPHTIPMSAGRAVQSTLGFFPLFPLTIRGLHALTGLSYLISGEILVTAFGATFAVALWWLMRHLFGTSVADRATALVCFFPGFFVFALIYSEPISLAFTTVCLYALIRRWWWVAGISAALASAARPNAIVLVACCAWAAAVAIAKRREWAALAALVLAPLGLLTYFTFLFFRTGNFWAYKISQEQAWQLRLRPSTPFDLVRTFVNNPSAGDSALRLLGCVVIVAAAVVLVRSHYPGVMLIYGIGLGTVDLFLVPSPRFVLAAFPLVAVIGHRLRGRWFALALVVCSGGLAGLLVLTVLGRATP